MSEYITKEDALEAIGEAYGDVAEAEDNVRAIPAADVVEVVRCKDCMFCSIGANDIEPLCWCLYWFRGTDPVGYCSHGERREDGADDAAD